MNKSIGLLGGTFDPPHIGHLVAADQVLFQLGLDEVWFLVAKDPWQKTEDEPITPAKDRLGMVRAAVEGFDGFKASDFEFSLPGPTYTVETLEALRQENPETNWYLILGSDSAAGLDTWHQPDRLADLAKIVVVNRGGNETSVPSGFHVENVQIPSLEVSSSSIRRSIMAEKSVRFLVPDRVIDHYRNQSIYSRNK